jgi:hypothetical protein
MHNISYIGVAGGYDNITDYCLSSCHKPTLLDYGGEVAPNLLETVHAARRLSCYHCHTDTYWIAIENKPGTDPEPNWCTAMRDFDDYVLDDPLFLRDTCIACKRAGSPANSFSERFKTWTEPSNVIYWYGYGYV